MAKKPSPLPAVYDFPYGESHEHTAVSIDDIPNLADKKPGLYAWYIRILPKSTKPLDLTGYGDFLGSKKYSIKLSAHLGELFEGKLKMARIFDPQRPANIDLISTITTVFSPPIYVGIAGNVRSRLMAHVKKLIDELALPQPASPRTPNTTTTSSSPISDSDDESGYFGGRVAELLRAQKMENDIRRLFVKIVFQPVDNIKERRSLEHFANRVFFPFCGRK